MNSLAAADAKVADPSDIAGAYAFCRQFCAAHYENFPVASRLLPWRLRPHVDALYAFARIADDFADAPEFAAVRRERLLDWRRQLGEAGRSAAAHPVFLALGRTIGDMDLPREPLNDLLSACLQKTEKRRYASCDELLDYCRRSANPVGRLILMMHGYRDDELFRYCDAICTALQLAKFWQDLSLDLKRDRIYIPEEDFKAYAYSEADLRMGVCNDRFRELMKFQINRTRSLFEQGRPLPGKVRWPLSWEVRVTWYGGRELLRKIRKRGFDTLTQRPVLTRWDWLPLTLRTVLKP